MTTPDRFWFLFSAYTAFWIVLALFLMRLGRRQRTLERELRDLRARLAATEAPGASSPRGTGVPR
jgi:CcmD family protein